MKEKWYLIQGFFFQPHLAVGELLIREEHFLSAAVQNGMFAGIVKPIQGSNEYKGCMTDYAGESKILDFVVKKDSLEFLKMYYGRTPVQYTFKKINAMWIGTYEGPDCGKGTAKCVLIEIDETFVLPEMPKEEPAPFTLIEEGVSERPKEEEF